MPAGHITRDLDLRDMGRVCLLVTIPEWIAGRVFDDLLGQAVAYPFAPLLVGVENTVDRRNLPSPVGRAIPVVGLGTCGTATHTPSAIAPWVRFSEGLRGELLGQFPQRGGEVAVIQQG